MEEEEEEAVVSSSQINQFCQIPNLLITLSMLVSLVL